MIDGEWPLSVPSGGTFEILTEDGKATAFAVEFSGRPSDIFSVVDGKASVNDHRWNEMRWFYARLKSYLQCATEIDFDPTEVEAHYIGETEQEKQQIPMYKLMVTKGADRRRRRILDHDKLAAAVFASDKDDVAAPYFIGELKSLSRRSEREERYVDSFRYDFLIVETLYGKGQFKSKQLADALKSNRQLLDTLETARDKTRLLFETPTDETATLICNSGSAEDLVDHIVKKRGYYFHGTKRIAAARDWRRDEARTLCVFSNFATDLILHG